MAGCTGFWDEVTSRNFEFKHLYSKPNPFVVLQNSTDGDERAKALRALREPKQFGGTDQDQEAVVKILVTAASKEKQFLCRVAAIDSLSRFKDPRAVTGLSEAFYASTSFPPDQATRIQCMAARALGETGNPEAVKFLVNIMKSPPSEGSEQDKQQALDVRIAAARGLGHFHDPQAAQALVQVMQKDKDIALRYCAHDSLQACTGKTIPSDFQAWDQLVKPGSDGATDIAESDAKKRKVLGLF
jgi:HEAT repeat protein